MDVAVSLRLLASTNNARGDLFTRLKKDLFFALGYDELQFDVHKPGRELDILGTHRHATRRLAVECKAHVKKMGGDAINKFRGAVAAERRECAPTPIDPYLVGLPKTHSCKKKRWGMKRSSCSMPGR
jgi:Restriction endonuclease